MANSTSEKGVMGEDIEITGHVPSPSPINHSPITIRSCRFDDPTISFTKAWHLMGFIVTATHTTNRWTEFNPENERCNSESFGKISLEGEKPKKMSYALVVISDSPTNEQDKSSEWRRIGVAVIDHDYLMLSESPEIVK